MKLDTDSKYVKISLHAFGVIAASIILWACVNNFGRVVSSLNWIISVLKPFIYGFIIAYIFNYPYKKFIKLFEKIKTKKPLRRGVIVAMALICTYALLISILVLFIYTIVPRIANALMEIFELVPGYVTSVEGQIQRLADSYLHKFNISSETIPEILNAIAVEFSGSVDFQHYVKEIASFVVNISVEVKNIALGLIISIYLLADKHRFVLTGKKLVYCTAGQKKGDKILEVLRFTDKTFGGYMIAKVVDSAIIGFLCYIGMSLLSLEYAVLISVLVGVTNIIPFFGPFIGAVPSVLLLLTVSPWQALIFLIFVLVLQQFDGNVLGPKLLGESTGIRAVYVVFAVIVGGGLFGVVGMFVGVPFFAVAYTLLAEYVNEKVKQKNLKID